METSAMARKTGFLFCMLLLASVSLSAYVTHGALINRKNFTEDFIFGAGESAYQSEGAADEDGRKPSIWDTFIKQHPEKIADGSNADIAEDFYHRYKEDIKRMKEMGLDSYRFSLSWSRILPGGKLSRGVNPLGIKFYNDVINELLANGINPFVTIYHWDLPQALEDEYGGLLSPNIVEDFRDFADLSFKEFGDRVNYWVTMNEPNLVAQNGYATGVFAPGRCSNYIGNCTVGNSATEPYIVAHHLLLCHAATVNLYKTKYQASQKGIIGISVAAGWTVPINRTLASRMAATRAFDFFVGWMLEPITYGNYPKTMREIAGSRLPMFSKVESEMLKKSFDFLGLNYYSASYAINNPYSNSVNLSYTTDNHVTTTEEKNGIPIGEQTPVPFFYFYPRGIRDVLLYIKEKYENPLIFISENGVGQANNSSLPIKEVLNDKLRIKFISAHLAYLLKAVKDGVNVKGYFVWSFLDDFEWSSGYVYRFGLNFVDFRNGLKRYPKSSAIWFRKFLAK